jgi:ubiquinone/menaquinone biosynthesis C-methylase UbiE
MQIEEILRVTRAGGSMLEVGKGTGVTAWYIQNAGIDVMTLDHLPDKQPSVVGDLRMLPFADGSFDVVVTFQVLEHLEFRYFTDCLRELGRVSKGHVIISIPNSSRSVSISAALPKLGEIRKVWEVPFLTRKSVTVKRYHYWELGVAGYPLERIRACMEDAGLSITKEFRVVENPFHHFFVLKKPA